jgi:hypothetical protein
MTVFARGIDAGWPRPLAARFEFHTFDSGGIGKSLGLLPLSGDVGGHRLVICKPQAKSPQLDPAKTETKPDDPEQYKWFLETAKEAEAHETAKGADKAFSDVVKPRKHK